MAFVENCCKWQHPIRWQGWVLGWVHADGGMMMVGTGLSQALHLSFSFNCYNVRTCTCSVVTGCDKVETISVFTTLWQLGDNVVAINNHNPGHEVVTTLSQPCHFYMGQFIEHSHLKLAVACASHTVQITLKYNCTVAIFMPSVRPMFVRSNFQISTSSWMPSCYLKDGSVNMPPPPKAESTFMPVVYIRVKCPLNRISNHTDLVAAAVLATFSRAFWIQATSADYVLEQSTYNISLIPRPHLPEPGNEANTCTVINNYGMHCNACRCISIMVKCSFCRVEVLPYTLKTELTLAWSYSLSPRGIRAHKDLYIIYSLLIGYIIMYFIF